MNIELNCNCCNKIFIVPYKQRNKKFCGRTCYFEFAKKNKLIGKKKNPNVREDRVCVECGKNFTERKKYERKLCSEECRILWNQKDENKNNRIDKSKKILMEKYGVDSTFKIKRFQENLSNIFMEKYGVTHPMHIEKSVDKLKSTLRKNQLQNLIPKLSEKNLILLDEYFANKSGNTSQHYSFKCTKCDTTFSSTLLGSGKIPICRKCYPINKNSFLEQIIKDFLNEKNIKFLTSYRKIIDNKEIDIYIPSHNLGLEINGNYFHSELTGTKDKTYHINKTKSSNDNGVKMIHFYEDEILLKKEIVFSKIMSKLNLNEKIHARKCIIKKVSKKDSSTFLTDNHLQGNCVDKYRYGLYYEDKLISLMTFGSKRNSLGNKNRESDVYELVRFCNKNYVNVIGGFSKLLKFFIKNHSPKKIETFADIRWSGINHKDTVYHKTGFSFVKITHPNYWYIKTSRYLHRYHRFKFRKDVLVKEGHSKELTEWEIMQSKGYDRIWDCGSLKYELILN